MGKVRTSVLMFAWCVRMVTCVWVRLVLGVGIRVSTCLVGVYLFVLSSACRWVVRRGVVLAF